MDLFSLPDIKESDLSSEKQRRLILEYLYTLTEQLRFVLNNLGAENLSDELKESIEGAYQKASALSDDLQDAWGNISSIRRTADSIQLSVQNMMGDISRIDQYAHSLTLSVSNGATSSVIQLTAGNTVIASQTINMSGLVSFTSLSTPGATTINGSNITTGSINAGLITTGVVSANYIDVNGLYVRHLNAADGTFTGTLSGVNGTFSGNLSAAGGTFTTLSAANGQVFFYPNYISIAGIYIGQVSGYNDVSVIPPSHQRGNVGVGGRAWSQCVAQYLYSSGGSVGSYSMRRLKENIKPFSEDIIDKLRCVRYNMIDDPDKTPQIGLIADNVKKYCPELVRKFKDCSMKKQVLTLAYDRITVILVDEAQRQRKRLKKIEKQWARARKDITALKRRANAQEKRIAAQDQRIVALEERLLKLEAKEA